MKLTCKCSYRSIIMINNLQWLQIWVIFKEYNSIKKGVNANFYKKENKF